MTDGEFTHFAVIVRSQSKSLADVTTDLVKAYVATWNAKQAKDTEHTKDVLDAWGNEGAKL